MIIDPNQQFKCAYCETTAPAMKFPMIVVGKGEQHPDGTLKARIRAICPECIINTFDAAHRPQTVTP